MAKRGTARYVFLDLGDNFTAGKMIRSNADMITLEVHRGKRCFRPAYSRATVHRMLSIDRSTAIALGRFAHPLDPTDLS
ncbi:MAG: hypothetical protein JWN30_462 [Bacilli bacterium]|nr:hypothetical protein [Bacilli bacterium]